MRLCCPQAGKIIKAIRKKYEKQVSLPLHSLLKDKENKDDAVKKHKERKEKIITICPPTCSGTQIHTFLKNNCKNFTSTIEKTDLLVSPKKFMIVRPEK